MEESRADRIRRLKEAGIDVNPNQYAAEPRLTRNGPVPDSAVKPDGGDRVGDGDSWKTYWATIGQPVVDNATASQENEIGAGSTAQAYKYVTGYANAGDIGLPITMEARPRRSGEKSADRPPREETLFRHDTGLSQQEWDDAMASADSPSGILPGEEQVSTQATLRSMTPEEQAAIRKRYDGSGHTGTMSFEDYLTDNFGELKPTDREVAMRRFATATPRMSLGRDPNLPPETNTALADSRRAAGKPLPEGRAARQYTPEQRAAMSENVESPEVPMTADGGSYTTNVDGTRNRRAPNQQMLATAEQIAADPEQGPESDSYLSALAQAYHIDAIQYGDDMDLLRADVMREKAKHDKLGQYLSVVPNPMSPGQDMYVSDPRKQEEGRRQFQSNMTARQRNNVAIRMARAYTRVMTDEDRERLAAAVQSPNGGPELEALRMDLQRRQGERSWANHLDRVAGQALSRDMANPERARGFMIQTLAAAVKNGDPMAQAAAYSMMGQPMLAIRAMDAAMNDRNAAAGLAGIQAQLGAQGVAEDNTVAGQLNEQLQGVLATPDDVAAAQSLRRVYMRSGFDAGDIPQMMEDFFLRNRPAHPIAQSAMKRMLKKGKAAFMEWAPSAMGITVDEASAVYDEEAGTPAEQGARSAQEWGQWAEDEAGRVAGFFGGGGGGGGGSPQAWGGAPPLAPPKK
jgi:hypothetical protein